MVQKAAKIPAFTKDTKFLSFDLESNGLHGKAFAVGALIIDSKGTVYDSFTARCEPAEPFDEWVADNIVPVLSDMQITHGSYEAMREAFWRWFVAAQEQSDYVVVHNGYPVEYRFLIDCQEANLEERYWQHPFPIIDAASLLLAVGDQREAVRKDAGAELSKKQDLKNHHPLDDATLSAMIAFEALQALN